MSSQLSCIESHFLEDWRNKWLEFVKPFIPRMDGYIIGGFCNNINFTLEMLLNMPKIWKTCQALGSNPNITIEDIMEHDEIAWSKANVLLNPNICYEAIPPAIRQQYSLHYYLTNPNFTETHTSQIKQKTQ